MASRVTRVAIAGAGRMGHSIAARIRADDAFELMGTWSRGDDLAELARDADVVIDFSLPGGTAEVVRTVAALGKPLVCGVSGLGSEQVGDLEKLSRTQPVVYDRNMSQGVTVLDAALRQVAGALGPEFTVSIAETHHVHKKDAPSGTALKLGETVAAARGSDPDEIDYSSERRGEVPGDHSVVFESPTERLVFEHSVTTREVFAAGALRAARWVVGRPAGLYSMQDVLFAE